MLFRSATGGESDLDSEAYVPNLYVSDEELEWVRKRFMKEDSYTYVLTVLNTSETYRNWPLNYYDKMFKIAEEDYPDIRFVISSDCRNEINFPENVIDATGFSFRRTIALTALADCVITPDTSVLHVAAAFEKKCIALFGPIDCNARCKHYKNTVCLYSELECGPCWRNDKIPCQHGQKVIGDHSYCMSRIKPDVVLGNLEVLCRT